MKSITVISGISNRETVSEDCNIKPTINKRAPCYINQWRKTDWVKLKSETVTLGNQFLEDSSSRSVSDNYTTFKKLIQIIINKHIPKRLPKIGKHNLPWIKPYIRRLCRRKGSSLTRPNVPIVAKTGRNISPTRNIHCSLFAAPIGTT